MGQRGRRFKQVSLSHSQPCRLSSFVPFGFHSAHFVQKNLESNRHKLSCSIPRPPPPYHLHGCVVCIIRFHSAVHHPAQCPCLLYKPLKPTPSLYTHRRILCRFRTIRSAGLTTAARPYQDGGSKKDAEYSKAASFPKPGDTSSPTSVAVRVPTLSPGRWMVAGY